MAVCLFPQFCSHVMGLVQLLFPVNFIEEKVLSKRSNDDISTKLQYCNTGLYVCNVTFSLLLALSLMYVDSKFALILSVSVYILNKSTYFTIWVLYTVLTVLKRLFPFLQYNLSLLVLRTSCFLLYFVLRRDNCLEEYFTLWSVLKHIGK